MTNLLIRGGIAIIVATVLWILVMGSWSLHIVTNQEWWNMLAIERGYAHFRDWLDPYFYLSFGVLIILTIPIWLHIEEWAAAFRRQKRQELQTAEEYKWWYRTERTYYELPWWA